MYKKFTRFFCTPNGYIPKFLRIMKLTTLILFIALMQVSAATIAQKVTYTHKQATLEQIIKEIRQQTGYNVLVSVKSLKDIPPADVNFKNTPLTEVLDQVLKNVPYTYEIQDKTILIKEKEATLINKVKAENAQVSVSGKVTDETGQPLAGVTIKLKGYTVAMVTSGNGQFSMSVPDENTVLIFSFIGYETVELSAKDIAHGSIITLKASQTNLREVVVSKGYYDEKRELSTGNVSLVTAKEIGNQPVSDPIMALEGRVPGMYISQFSGTPGAFSTVLIRGQNSLSNGNFPFYIVDGVPFNAVSLTNGIGAGALGQALQTNAAGRAATGNNGGMSPFNSLNPSDIESIEVLKDADATAIYGSRGANGVILITTKKGKAGQTRVDLNLNSGIGHVASYLPMLNTQQYIAMRLEAFKNDGVLPGPGDYDVNGVWDKTRYTDWQKYLIGNNAHFTNADLSLSGGNTNTTFRVSGHYGNQTTVFPGNSGDQKASVILNLNHVSSNQKFHSSFNAQYVNDNNLLPGTDLTNRSIINYAPDAPAIYDGQGNINWENGTWFNPLAYTFQTARSITDNLIANANLDYEILNGLKLTGSIGYNRQEMNQSNQTPATVSYGPPIAAIRENDIANTTNNTWIIEPQLDYRRSIGRGKLDVLVGGTIQQNIFNTLGQRANGFSSDDLISNVANASTITVANNLYKNYRYAAIYGRINYNWEDKYLLNATARRDGSSRFGPGNQFGNFGAVGAAWIFSKENFIANALPFLSFGKLRGSYGTTGNDQITDYQYLSTYSASGSFQNTSALGPNRIASPYFAWEVNKKLEGGLELGFLKDRIDLSISYYRNRSGNQLVGQPLPSQVGFTSIQANLPAVVQNSGLEVELNTINVQSSSFSWKTSFNISSSRNKLVSFPGLAYNSNYSGSYVVGQSIFYVKQYHVTGINPQTGIYMYQDLNANGILDSQDQQFGKQVTQDYFGGFSNSFSYRGLQLDVFFQFVKQTGYNYLNKFAGGAGAGIFNNNVPTYFLDHWQRPGDLAVNSIYTTGSGNGVFATRAGNNINRSDASISDASFVRLKNVSLSYSLPQKLIQPLALKNLRVYVQGQNLFTITNYLGLDPETPGLNLAPLRMVSLGIQATL